MEHRPPWSRSVRTGALLVLGGALLAAACFGIVFWSWQGSVLGVVLSALLPGSGAIWTLARPWKAKPSRWDER
jgi:hypothetical protein